MPPTQSPERALLDAADAYASAVAGQRVLQVTLLLSDGMPRVIPAPASARAAPTAARAMLSPDALAVMAVVAERGPVAPKSVVAAAGVERSKCYVILTDLKDRGLILDRGDGYEVADRELWGEIRGLGEAA